MINVMPVRNQNDVKDSYLKNLGSIITAIEISVGLNKLRDTAPLSQAPLSVVLDTVQSEVQKLKSTSTEAYRKIINDINESLIILNYTSSRMQYFKQVSLDFRTYPKIETIANVLITFATKTQITADDLKLLNSLATILEYTEKRVARCYSSLSYRYLRIFLILVLYSKGSYFLPSIVAHFLLTQMGMVA